MKAAGVGWDRLMREGRISQALPLTLGSEVIGTVAALGDAIYGATNDQFVGGYAEYALVEAGKIARKPAALDYIRAAGLPVVAVTAWQMLFQARADRTGDKRSWCAARRVVSAPAGRRWRWKPVLASMGPRAPGTSNACGATSAIQAVADGGRLATITPDPPSQQRGITVSSIYVRAHGNQLRILAQRLEDGQLRDSDRHQLPPRRRPPGARPGNWRPRQRSHRPHALTNPGRPR